ncbi:MAG: hypothetical protein KKB13_06560, partial [Chloroflexi bacterium]|nr:hypothetical protein [Chloroflexota bacterium]
MKFGRRRSSVPWGRLFSLLVEVGLVGLALLALVYVLQRPEDLHGAWTTVQERLFATPTAVPLTFLGQGSTPATVAGAAGAPTPTTNVPMMPDQGTP